MDTQQLTIEPVNEKIYEVAEVTCMTMMERSEKGVDLYARRDALIEAIEGKVPHETAGKIADLFVEFGCVFGQELFALGLAIGRDPSLLFDLPDVDM